MLERGVGGKRLMECQICGREAWDEALLEGARVYLCPACMKFGRPVEKPAQRAVPSPTGIRKPLPTFKQKEFDVVDDYAALITQAREKMGLTRQQLARQLFMMENVLERIEHGHLRPDLKTAEKLEKALGIRLVEEGGSGNSDEDKKKEASARSKTSPSSKDSDAGLSLADLVDVKVKE